MKTHVKTREQKHFFIRSYSELPQLRKSIALLKKHANNELHLSVLGKFLKGLSFKDERQQAVFEKQLKDYWNDFLGPKVEFGVFKNPDIGTIFIIGALTSMFLHEIDGKALGGMSTGLYGILRGLGAYRSQVDIHLKALKEGDYLLIVRGSDSELERLQTILV